MSSMLKIHPARDAQLAALAAKRGTTKTAALDYLINLAIQHGEMPDVLPGFEAWTEGDAVVVAVEGVELPAMAPRKAAALGELLTALITSKHPKAPGRGMSMSLHNGGTLDVGRIGGGIVMRFTDAAGDAGKVATLTPTMAADFSRALTTAAHFAAAPVA